MRSLLLNNLQVRVAAVFLLVAIVPLGAVAAFSVRTADRVIAGIVVNQLENVAADKQELLQRWMAERKADVAVVAHSSVLQSFDPALIRPFLEIVRTQYGVYHRFVVVGPDGKIVYDTDGRSSGSGKDMPGYRQVLEGETYVSNVIWDDSRKEAVFIVAEAIHGPDSQSQGVVCVTVSTQAIAGRVLNVSLGKTGECYLVDREGTFLAHREPHRILRENIAQSGSFAKLFEQSNVGPIYTDYRGIAVLGATRPVAGTPWYIVVEQDYAEAFAGSERMARHIWVAIAVTLLGAVGMSWVLARHVTSPIRSLSEAANSLSRGDFETALASHPAERSDEIGVLHAAFHHMAEQLYDRQTRLQQRIGVTEEELRRSEAKLKETLEAVARSERLAALGRLSSGVAHEIRTPLASLKLFLQSLREDMEMSPDQSEDFEIAMRQILRMEATINHFLNFARPQEPCLAEVHFDRLVEDALLVVKPRANQQEVEIERVVEPDLPKVEGDSRQLGEVLVNLLVNALEVMPDGGRIAIRVAPSSEDEGDGRRQVQIDVSDTGPGIPPRDVDRLFEPFFTTKATGSGLGLAIAHGTVERHGGEIKVHTKPGAGTTFTIRLPAAESAPSRQE